MPIAASMAATAANATSSSIVKRRSATDEPMSAVIGLDVRHRQLAVERRHLAAQHRRERQRFATGPRHDRQAVHGVLGVRQVHLGGRVAIEAGVLHVADDADDRLLAAPHLLARQPDADVNRLADRILARPVPRCGGLVDQHHLGTVLVVVGVEHPSRLQRDPHGHEVTGRHDAHAGRRRVGGVRLAGVGEARCSR